ncbi:hypothetical protein [Paraburkholderia sp. MM5384-R2]|uniref:hypothetical protein n=1 Tax=Paraburkholderia sp. MM5384-R2 TaxID=2723097 RepID=UPI00160F4E0D|nr:hypothetical protein [Paraburkholderia sp. MM5384-R2]MBB5498681.1 hypothetical protein [Paraburkholderia sp. MM5384-R2]
MIGTKTVASDGSVSMGGDNRGSVVNISGSPGARVTVANASKKLPSYLAQVINVFAEFDLNEPAIASSQPSELLPPIEAKLIHNQVTDHSLVRDYRLFFHLLLRAYQGVEQQNSSARELVRRSAGRAYEAALTEACVANTVSVALRQEFACMNAHLLLDVTIARLTEGYKASINTDAQEIELVDLAISLVVFDAMTECLVLARPKNAVAA